MSCMEKYGINPYDILNGNYDTRKALNLYQMTEDAYREIASGRVIMGESYDKRWKLDDYNKP